ncbi:hypothetical protein CfE428DRAFT_5249 [Chthoniobacter flavus Ellin428]|uniref:Uncharacterized protein n=1 Tax=Chthoniobacter flavus Ellin428 TaxID=497964 RepID=B4D8K9_9BACT|nr:hypothetical protein [Chthoniobacter flavus]EDY17231.1 hypothetical protein CfE428DRAFT_5249 [Chthoniobacter flavus Ellin428]TCO86943.1 hypothetical protein EV701_12538 [Chthoniobacter flavus]
MFSLFKRKAPPAPTETTFKTRVARFWEWYASVADRYYRTIEEKRVEELAGEVRQHVNQVIPGLAWVFGPGANEQGHSLTVSAEGNPHYELLAAYWQKQAPKLPGWTFYGSRQPSQHLDTAQLKIGEHLFEGKAFWLTPTVDADHQRLNLTAWHPLFPKLDDRTRWMVLFLMLDEALGEIGTQNWIGRVEMNDQNLAGAMPLTELRTYLERVHAQHQWKKGGPGESVTLYRLNEERPGELRGDIFVGSTAVKALIGEFSAANGQLKDPLAGTGADYVYIAFDIGVLPKGNEANARGEIEDALMAVLGPAAGGQVLGGAMGRCHAYIDLLLFDGANSINLVLDVLRKRKMPAGTSLNYFAHEKRGHRLIL